jgi:hypothetical protein
MPNEITLVSSSRRVRSKTLPGKLHHCWMVSRWLSLDVAAGALICCLMACRIAGVSPYPWYAVAVLSGTVLIIYTMDHVLDIWQTNGSVFSPRRQFHWRYLKQMLLASVLLICLVGVTTLLFLPWKLIGFGFALSVLVLGYLWLVNKLNHNKGLNWLHKEFIVACLYTTGIWGVAFSYSHAIRSIDLYLATAFGLIALQNLLLFSLFEREEDLLQGQPSVALSLGNSATKWVLGMVFIVFAMICLIAWKESTYILEKQVIETFFMMAAVLCTLFAFPSYFAQHKRYRWLGDGIFLMPVWLLV